MWDLFYVDIFLLLVTSFHYKMATLNLIYEGISVVQTS